MKPKSHEEIINSINSAIGGSQLYGPGTLTTAAWPQPVPLSIEEFKELEKLENEHKDFVKQNRLSKFKSLPQHLRQEIVDEAYIRDMINSLLSDDDANFTDMQKLKDLRNKKNSQWNSAHAISTLGVFNGFSPNTKYEPILRHFKTEELAKAHAESCIEEELKN